MSEFNGATLMITEGTGSFGNTVLKHFDNWYEVYHFILQKRLLEQYERDSVEESKIFPGTMVCDHLEPMTEKYFANLKRYGTYCKDFVKALCVPFAYNLPRYKNLAIDGMFDKNKPGKNMKPAPEKDEEKEGSN